jgi:hypothetical protein
MILLIFVIKPKIPSIVERIWSIFLRAFRFLEVVICSSSLSSLYNILSCKQCFVQATPSITIVHISFILVSYKKIYSLSANYIVHFIFFPIVFFLKKKSLPIYM